MKFYKVKIIRNENYIFKITKERERILSLWIFTFLIPYVLFNIDVSFLLDIKIGNFSSKDFRNPIELLLFLVFISKKLKFYLKINEIGNFIMFRPEIKIHR